MSWTRGRTTSSASPALVRLRRARPNGSAAAPRAGRRVATAPAGRGMRYAARAVSPRPRAAARGSGRRAGPRRTSRCDEQRAWRACRGSRPGGRSGPRRRRGGGRGAPGRLDRERGAPLARSHERTATTTSSTRGDPEHEHLEAPSRKLPTTSPSAAPSATTAPGERRPRSRLAAARRVPPAGALRGRRAHAGRARHRHRRPADRRTTSPDAAPQLGVGREQEPVLEHRGQRRA